MGTCRLFGAFPGSLAQVPEPISYFPDIPVQKKSTHTNKIDVVTDDDLHPNLDRKHRSLFNGWI
jgi:hypothetical protein